MRATPSATVRTASAAVGDIEAQLRNLWHMHVIGAVATPPALLVLLWEHGRADRLVAWAVFAMSLAMVMALTHYRTVNSRRAVAPTQGPVGVLNAVPLTTAVSGAALGSIVLFDTGSLRDPAYAFGVAACLVAFCAGSFVNLSPRSGLIRMAIYPTLAPAVVMMFAAGQWRVSACLITFVGIVGLRPLSVMRANYESLLRLSHEARWDAEHDPLTGLLNRGGLARSWQGSDALIYIDLDGFKLVNDRYGHAIGDLVLCEAASRLRGAALSDGSLVGRLGGDEFLIAIRTDDSATVLAAARHASQRLSEPFTFASTPGIELHMTASMGVAWTEATGGVEEAVAAADAAMYRDKFRTRRVGERRPEPIVVDDRQRIPAPAAQPLREPVASAPLGR